MRRLALLMALVSVAACSTYAPTSAPVPGSTVRVRVPVTSALDDRNAAGGSAVIEGTVLEARDTLVLAVTTRQEYGAFREIMMYDTLRLAPDQRMTVEEATFSTKRTAVLTTAIVVGAVALAAAAFTGGGGGGNPPTDPPPPTPQGAVVISNSFVSGVLGILGIAR